MEVRGWDDRKLANAGAFTVPVFASVTVVSANRGGLSNTRQIAKDCSRKKIWNIMSFEARTAELLNIRRGFSAAEKAKRLLSACN